MARSGWGGMPLLFKVLITFITRVTLSLLRFFDRYLSSGVHFGMKLSVLNIAFIIE